MAEYSLFIKKSAQKEIRALNQKLREQIIELISSLKIDPRPLGSKKLIGYENYWRIRKGDYRVIYSINDNILVVEVIAVKHRKDAYS